MPADEWLDFFSDVLGEASRTFYEILRDKKVHNPLIAMFRTHKYLKLNT